MKFVNALVCCKPEINGNTHVCMSHPYTCVRPAAEFKFALCSDHKSRGDSMATPASKTWGGGEPRLGGSKNIIKI